MAEKYTPVETVKVEYVCDKCGVGTMTRDNRKPFAYLTDPAQFPHICLHCKHEQTFTVNYPTTGYRDVV